MQCADIVIANDISKPLKTDDVSHLRYFGWYGTRFSTADFGVTGIGNPMEEKFP